jgi:AcrR family transcriptional regulator
MATPSPRTAPGRTQRERSETTIAELVKAARGLFVEKGYADTRLDDVVDAAGLTKGAVYHHFNGKRDLFRAVYEREQQSLAEVSLAAYQRKRDPKRGFYEACRAFFEASLDPGVQRITLIDAPAALGWDGMREVEDRYSMALIVNGLQLAIDDGLIAKRPVEPLAHLIFGATCEGVMLVARSEDQGAMTRKVLAELKNLIDAF